MFYCLNNKGKRVLAYFLLKALLPNSFWGILTGFNVL